MTLKPTDLSPELLHYIFSLCSRRDLTRLSRVNSTFKQAAEYLLYRHIYFSRTALDCGELNRLRGYNPLVHESPFWTLSSNPEKAALIRSFHLQFTHIRAHGQCRGQKWAANICLVETAGPITDALRDAHGLVDLRITSTGYSYTSKERLNKAIKSVCKKPIYRLHLDDADSLAYRSGYFQLHTLYTDSFLDLEEIIICQKHLRLLGIKIPEKDSVMYSKFSELIKNLSHSRIDGKGELPDLFMFSTRKQCADCEITEHLSKLTLFPELCLPGQAITLCSNVVTSLCRDVYKDYHGHTDCKFTIHIFDFAHAEVATISEMIEGMGQYFFGCEDLTVRLQTSAEQGTVLKPWRIPGFSNSVSRIKRLRRLTFFVPGDNSLPLHAAMDFRSFLLEELNLACLALKEVCVQNNSKIARLGYPRWNIVTGDS